MSLLGPQARLAPPFSVPLFRRVLRSAPALAWRLAHPSLRGAFSEPRPGPLICQTVPTADGGRAAIRWLEPRPGAVGDPVLVVHPFGCGPDALRATRASSLAEGLVRTGFRPGLVAHRGDSDADFAGDGSLDAVVAYDMSAVCAAASTRGPCDVVGHGVGAWLVLRAGAHDGRNIRRVVAVAPPVRLPEVRSLALCAEWLVRLLPGHWPSPIPRLARLGAPWVGDPQWPSAFQSVDGAALRGVLSWGTSAPPWDTIEQLTRWLARGTPTDRSGSVAWMDTLVDGRAPLLVLAGDNDPWCTPEDAARVARAWGGMATVEVVPGLGHLDPVVAPAAAEAVADRVSAWLRERQPR